MGILISKLSLMQLKRLSLLQTRKLILSCVMLDLGKLSIISKLFYSGSTCISILTYGKRIYVANVGDSRALIARTYNDCN